MSNPCLALVYGFGVGVRVSDKKETHELLCLDGSTIDINFGDSFLVLGGNFISFNDQDTVEHLFGLNLYGRKGSCTTLLGISHQKSSMAFNIDGLDVESEKGEWNHLLHAFPALNRLLKACAITPSLFVIMAD